MTVRHRTGARRRGGVSWRICGTTPRNCGHIRANCCRRLPGAVVVPDQHRDLVHSCRRSARRKTRARDGKRCPTGGYWEQDRSYVDPHAPLAINGGSLREWTHISPAAAILTGNGVTKARARNLFSISPSPGFIAKSKTRMLLVRIPASSIETVFEIAVRENLGTYPPLVIGFSSPKEGGYTVSYIRPARVRFISLRYR